MSRSFRLVSLLIAILPPLATPSLMASWQHLPYGQRTGNSLIANSSGQHLWLSAGSAGLWRSMDSGQTWNVASLLLHPLGRISTNRLIDVSGTGDTLICQARRSGAYWKSFSYDTGQTWQRIADENIQDFGELYVWPHGHNAWFFVCSGSESWQILYRSLDYGQTWTFLSNDISDRSRLYADPFADSTLYAADMFWAPAPDPAMWRSNDLGETWEPILAPDDLPEVDMAQISGICRTSNGILLVAGYFPLISGEGNVAALYATTDEGQTWELYSVLPGDPWISQAPLNSLIEDMSLPGRLYLVASGGLWQSDDYGLTWGINPNLPQLGDGGYTTVAYQNPQSGALYAFVEEHGLFRSHDHGESWEPLENLPVGFGYSSLFIDDEAVIAETHGESESMAWQLEFPSLVWFQLGPLPEIPDSSLDMPFLWYKHGDSLIAQTGCTARRPDSTSFHLTRLVLSTDNGLNWNVGPVLEHDLRDGRGSVFLVGDVLRILSSSYNGYWYPDTLFMTTDLGATWSFLGIWTDYAVADIEQNENKICIIAGDGFSGGRVYCTTDLGATWVASPQTITGNQIVLLGNDVFVEDYGSCAWWSESGWEVRGEIPTSTNCWWSTCFEMVGIPGNPPTLVGMLDDSNQVFISNDRALTWEARDYVLPFSEQNAYVHHLTYDPYRHRLWVSAGIGVCYLDAAELSADGPLVFKPADYTLLSVYPNPFNSETQIRFDLLKREQVSVKVYDLLGREVQTLVDEWREAGRHDVSLSLVNCSSGLYFVQLHSSSASKVEKIMLLK